jgi:putative transposase
MRRIDELCLRHPFLGSRRIAGMLSETGDRVNRKRVQRLMRQIGIAALGPKPNASKPAPGHKIYPDLLRDLKIERANQVWAADITYIATSSASWIGRAAPFFPGGCRTRWIRRSASRRSRRRWLGKPEIFNPDQGSQFARTSSPRLRSSCTSHGVIAPVSIPMRASSPACRRTTWWIRSGTVGH